MANKKSTSRIINEMNETLRGLHRCGVLTTQQLEKFINSIEEKTKCCKSFDESKKAKS
jgi:hypothetical protein